MVIEEFFYLVAPAFLFVIYRVTKGNLGSMLKLLSCAVVAIFLIAKLLVVRHHSLDQWQPFFMYSVQFPFKMDELIIGLIAAIFVRNHKTGVTISGLLLCAGCGFCIGVIAFLNHTSAWREPYTLMREVAWLPTIFAGGVALCDRDASMANCTRACRDCRATVLHDLSWAYPAVSVAPILGCNRPFLRNARNSRISSYACGCKSCIRLPFVPVGRIPISSARSSPNKPVVTPKYFLCAH